MLSRLGCGLGVLLMGLAMVALFGLVVLPVVPATEGNTTIDRALGLVLCRSGETLARDLYSRPATGGGVQFSMTVDCIGLDGVTRNVTGLWTAVSMAAFVLPFLLGLTLAIFSFVAGVLRGGGATVVTVPTSTPGGMPGTGGSLAARLQELEEARKQGLITDAEYERMRREIVGGK